MGEVFAETFLEPHSEEWHKWRADGVCGSDLPTIMGRPIRWGSRFDLYYQKRYADAHLYADDEAETDYAYWGTSIEPNIRNRFASGHPEFRIRQAGSCLRLGDEWRRCNPDGWIYETAGRDDASDSTWLPVAGFEAKNADQRMRDHWGEAATQGVPQQYYDQVQWCMDVTSIGVWFVAVLFGGNTYHELQVTYDEAYAGELRREAGRFWQQVIDGDQPELDGHPATLARLKRLHPTVEDTEVEVSADLAARYRNAVAVRRAADVVHKAATNELRAAMGSAYRAVDPDGASVATRSVSDRAGYTVKPTTIDKLNPTKPRKAKDDD